MYKIEKNIPVPHSSKGRKQRYPFASMEPGDSFLVADKELEAKVRMSANGYGYRHSKRFVVRLVDEGVRVWRAENESK
jgi:hypothetical protein